jgi:NAD(P)-dependent dehydrogenase (short-subunit alcohol dehydrogenase family)
VGSGVTLEGTRCVVTGANAGIGREIATALARHGADVTLVCRNRARGEAAATAIREATGNPRVGLLLCDVGDLFTRELARRARDRGVIATCFHPGAVGSEFGQDEGGLLNVGMRLVKRFLRTPARGADTGIWLATSPEAASLSGQYVVDRRVRTPRGRGTDDALAAELWERCARFVGLSV